MTGNALQIIYRVMIKRISKGFSAEELSFLIGREQNYIAAIETCKAAVYTDEELRLIAIALNESNIRSFYPQLSSAENVSVEMERQKKGNKIVHTCDIVTPEGYRQPFFNLEEDTLESSFENGTGPEDKAIAYDAVDILLRSGYFFEAKLPYKVFQSINRFLESISISPFYIQLALDNYCEEVKENILMKVVDQDRRILYVES